MRQDEPFRAAVEHDLFELYSEAVPGREAIECLKALAPLVEVGAGAGYWARILGDHGGNIDAFDREPRAVSWTPVRSGGIEVVERYPGRPVFACWPYRPTGYMPELLERARDRTLALIIAGIDNPIVGDWLGQRLRAGWTQQTRVQIPTWRERGDELTI
jgi:hypothetical protein